MPLNRDSFPKESHTVFPTRGRGKRQHKDLNSLAEVSNLSLTKAVNVFRKSPVIERNFSRLKGRPLGGRPLYIHREDHACGMIRLLSIAFRVLTLLDYVVRKELQSSGEILMGLYEGNPRRQTSVPTTERLLKAFDNIHLNIVEAEEKIRHVTPLSALQKHILTLLSLSPELYENLELSFDTS